MGTVCKVRPGLAGDDAPDEDGMLLRAAYGKAVSALHEGLAVVFPTDSVYGIAVSVLHAASPERIFQIKHRDRSKAIPWLVRDPSALDTFSADVPAQMRLLAQTFWPGALTLIVAASDAVPAAFRCDDGTIALRMPDSDIALGLIERTGSPLATSSANTQAHPSPADSADLERRIIDEAAVTIDAGPCPVGVASTIVAFREGKLEILREGAISGKDIEEALHG